MSGDSDMEYSSDNECEYDDYYNIGVPDVDVEQIDRRKSDPEFLEYTCLDMEAVEKLLNETVEQLSNIIKVTPWLAKVLLLEHKWNIGDVREKYRIHALGVMIRARIIPAVNAAVAPTGGGGGQAGGGSGVYKFRTVDPALEIAAASGLSRFALHAHKVDWPPGPNNLSWLIGTKTATPAAAATSLTMTAAAAAALSLSTLSASPAPKMTIGPSVTAVVTASTATNTASSVSSSALAALATPTYLSPSSASARTSPSGASLPVVPNICCPVCICPQPPDQFYQLYCAHAFCRDCWTMHFETQIQLGVTTAMGCMATRCNIRVPEELVLALLAKPQMRDKYQQFAFLDYVKSHPNLRFCPGPNCQTIVQSADAAPKKATCSACATSFCYRCGTDYHAPTDCRVIRRWLTKCADDSETANYISAHTKDCPKCHICIEKNGGCNHMQCFNCKHDFCWMCVGDWKTHGSEYYECSRYKENPNIANESVHVQAREALKKYLHYYERWENHSKSLQLEQQTLDRLKSRINKKVMKGLGTWIDWQHLFNAAALLARCRYTLQYTYPYAYFMEAGSRKDLFEYQQAQLEAEIENLSWKIERAETTDRGDLENQMDVAEKRRVTLIKDFFLIDV